MGQPEVIRTGDGIPLRTDHLSEHYIRTETSLVERPMHSLKHGDAFAVLDGYGNVGTIRSTPEGLFFRDTRYVSRMALLFEGKLPLLLNSVLQDDNAALSVYLANPDIRPQDDDGIPRDTVAMDRTQFLWDDTFFERIGIKNFGERALSFRVGLRLDADFKDLFEVRGTERVAHGVATSHVLDDRRLEFRYVGLDNVTRCSQVIFDPPPERVDAHGATFRIELPAYGRTSILMRVAFQEGARDAPQNFIRAYRDKRRAARSATQNIATVESSNTLFNELMCRSTADLYMLTTDTGEGLYPYAGIPWYSTVFGRDGIITAMEMLWIDPTVAAGVLRYLASTQATAVIPTADAQPGKILHELRRGEMARTGEVPFLRYYGTVDATPLFVMLAGMYQERTNDTALIRDIWPAIQAAMEWCETYGDPDKDGFIEYFRQTEDGLANQGWKDSADSIFHADGSLARGPIALCEVQSYYFAALQHAARMARSLDDVVWAKRLVETAEQLRVKFEAAFWCEELGTYALALDGKKARCDVRTSNAGHALFCGIASPERAARTAATLMSQDGFSGWGVRTLARGQARYNPMSYHNGSIWPHDNAIVAMGLSRYGFKNHAATIFKAVFDAAVYQEYRRLPELYCGFLRQPKRGPVGYPVACSPQAWAAAAPFALLSACLGLELSADTDKICLNGAVLPKFLQQLDIFRLKVGHSSVDLRLRAHESDVAVNMLNRTGTVSVIISR